MDEVVESRVALMKRLNKCTVISVKGYDTYLDKEDVRKALWRHFSGCCEIIHVHVYKIYANGAPNPPLGEHAIIHIKEEAEQVKEKVMALSGTDVGGWTVVVEFIRSPVKDCDVTDERQKMARKVVVVRGYDPSLYAYKIKKKVTKHFSSCGEVMDISVNKRDNFVIVFIFGQGSFEKALQLNGTVMGGFKIHVRSPYVRQRRDVPIFRHRGSPRNS
ncbi:unnamed protein product [Cochlearia groenlandica]